MREGPRDPKSECGSRQMRMRCGGAANFFSLSTTTITTITTVTVRHGRPRGADAIYPQPRIQRYVPFLVSHAANAPDRKLRNQSLEALTLYLSSRPALSTTDARKLWTGLYYALWMTDRQRAQSALATDLANLTFELREACVEGWLRAFWAVMSEKWSSIDALRMDKFLTLVRRVFNAHLRLVKKRKNLEQVVAVLKDECFTDNAALGLRLHTIDIWVDELEREKVLKDPKAPLVWEVGALVGELARDSNAPAVRRRATESYADDRLPWHVEADESDEDEGWAGLGDES